MDEGVGEETAESACGKPRAPEEREASLELVAFVVHGHEVRAPGNKSSLKHPKEDAASYQPAVTVDETLTHAGDAPKEAQGGDPGRGRNLAEDEIAGDLEEDVRHEEDLESDVELVTGEVKLLKDTKDANVAEVDAVHEPEHEEDP